MRGAAEFAAPVARLKSPSLDSHPNLYRAVPPLPFPRRHHPEPQEVTSADERREWLAPSPLNRARASPLHELWPWLDNIAPRWNGQLSSLSATPSLRCIPWFINWRTRQRL